MRDSNARDDLRPEQKMGAFQPDHFGNEESWELGQNQPLATEAEITSRFRREPAASRGLCGFAARSSQATFRGKLAYVTTLLASVGQCSRPEMNPPRNPLLRHHAACQRGAVFRMRDDVIGTMSGLEHGSTLASSVAAGVRDVISATVASSSLAVREAASRSPGGHPGRTAEGWLSQGRRITP